MASARRLNPAALGIPVHYIVVLSSAAASQDPRLVGASSSFRRVFLACEGEELEYGSRWPRSARPGEMRILGAVNEFFPPSAASFSAAGYYDPGN